MLCHTFTADELEAIEQDRFEAEAMEQDPPEGRRLHQKPRARVSTDDAGHLWVRFNGRPPASIRAALKQSGAQFFSRRGAWMLPEVDA